MNHLAHFAINADDVPATRRFYEAVFGWKFTPYGPPDFFRIDTGSQQPVQLFAALQKRRALVPGGETHGFECTIAVESVESTEKAIRAHGGKILMERTTLAGVGYLLFFSDPSGNYVGAMQYDSTAE